jgi:hypothetical protein
VHCGIFPKTAVTEMLLEFSMRLATPVKSNCKVSRENSGAHLQRKADLCIEADVNQETGVSR